LVKKLMLLGAAVGLLGNAAPVFASDDLDTVSINSVSVGCDAQSLSFSGTATYSEPVQHLVVTLDSVELLHDHHETESWTVGPVSVGVGTHTLVATIYDHFEGAGHEDMMAQDTEVFSVPSCGASSSGSGDGVNRDVDCCPGPDKPATVTKQIARVKGVAVSSHMTKLMPLNSIFRKVFGRTPTWREWSYWAHRLLTDKMQYDALYGAMQWQQLHGHTIGK
jgi:hypothetical protein